MNILNGFKTVIAGLVSISLGVFLLYKGEYEKGAGAIVFGLGLLGIGGKIQKLIDSVTNLAKE